MLKLAVVILLCLSCGCSGRSASPAESRSSQPATSEGMTGGALRTKSECPAFAVGDPMGRIDAPNLTEISGLAASRTYPGMLWIHNDSGDGARIYAIATDGTPLGTYTLVGVEAVDWEDMAADQKYLYVGDIGDNVRTRRSIAVYRVAEPPVAKAPSSVEMSLTKVDRLTLVYPDGPKDAETLLVDPVSGDLFIVTKEPDNNALYRARAPQAWNRGQIELEKLGLIRSLKKRSEHEQYGGMATGGDVSASGDAVIIRGYWHAYLWPRDSGTTIGEALAKPACEIPIVAPLADGQAEAIGFDVEGNGYYTIPEALESVPQIQIYYFKRK